MEDLHFLLFLFSLWLRYFLSGRTKQDCIMAKHVSSASIVGPTTSWFTSFWIHAESAVGANVRQQLKTIYSKVMYFSIKVSCKLFRATRNVSCPSNFKGCPFKLVATAPTSWAMTIPPATSHGDKRIDI